jgi:hypothetical protein
VAVSSSSSSSSAPPSRLETSEKAVSVVNGEVSGVLDKEALVRAAFAAVPAAKVTPESDAASARAIATAEPALAVETATPDVFSKAVPAIADVVPQALVAGTVPVAAATATQDLSAAAVPATAVEVRQRIENTVSGLIRPVLARGVDAVRAIYAHKFAPAAAADAVPVEAAADVPAAAAVPVATVSPQSDAVSVPMATAAVETAIPDLSSKAVPALAIDVSQPLPSGKIPVEASAAVPVAKIAPESDAASFPMAIAAAAPALVAVESTTPDLSSQAIPAMAVAVPQVLASSSMPVAEEVTPDLSAYSSPATAVVHAARQPPKLARAHAPAVPAVHAASVHRHAIMAVEAATCSIPHVDSSGVTPCALLESVEDAGACERRWPALANSSVLRLDVDHAEDGLPPTCPLTLNLKSKTYTLNPKT